MKKLLAAALKLATSALLLGFLFSVEASAQTCEVRTEGKEVIIDIEDLGTANAPIPYKVTVYTDTCKSFNAGQNYQKAFCGEVEEQQVGETSTTARIGASVFHSGHYYVLVHFKGRDCPVEINDPIAQCEFEITVADGAQKCGPGSCAAEKTCQDRSAEECCAVVVVTGDDGCSQGYKPVLSSILVGQHGGWNCKCDCIPDVLVQYKPCEPIEKQCKEIAEQLQKAVDAGSPDEEIEKYQNKLAGCEREYDACLECVHPPATSGKEAGAWTALGCIAFQPGEFIATLIRIGFGIGGGIAFLFMIVGAFKVLTSEGNPETLNAGRQMIINAIAGLVLIIFSVIVLKIIGVDVLQLPGFVGP